MPELDSQLVPPGVNDERARAFVALIERGMAEIDPKRLLVKRVHSVASDVLPALVVEYSAQVFLADGVRQEFVRNILTNIWELKARTSTVEGCLFGLSLLGMRARWTQWFAEVPKDEVGTYKARIFIEEPVIEGDVEVLSRGAQAAALKMVDAMKRHSQEGTIGFGLSRRGEARLYGYSRSLSTRRIGAFRPARIETSGQILAGGLARAARVLRAATHPLRVAASAELALAGACRSSRLMRIA
ncbi:hypothetical protein SAMN06297251_111153 [Fulvimarina manganoxydans]|uniref:Phage tail protein, P2 protein I family n=1 Tax=Fulvimarina manganoxydans TaxID=937218 RepID=A0A1W2CVH4_9HYPH|nr:hypothetical protein [Fulvimarina manganoxydans]SMC89220.1 hypothetical protein SAMN06297251_111153 [Fulvimarina manganoxydans]